MWRDGRTDEGMVAPAGDKVAAVGQAVVVGRRVGGGKTQHSLAADGPQADAGGGGGNVVFVIVHVGKAAHARADHLGAGQARAQAAKVVVHELAFHRHHIAIEPHVEAQVVGQAAQQVHGYVGMGVYQAGDDGCAAAINYLACVAPVQ